MPLLDHFHPPVSERRSWEGFHSLWAAAMVEKLNEDVLGEEYFADMHVHVGSQVEIDVATLTEMWSPGSVPQRPLWAPEPAALVMPAVFPDDVEVQVFATAAGASLVAAVELVSPGNKDRPDTRAAFGAKCAAYLARGVGLVVADVVTSRLVNLHNEVVRALGLAEPFLMPADAVIYAVAYRPSRRSEGDRIEVWPLPLRIGQPLPVLPLGLRNAGTVPLDLETTYGEACRRSRIRLAA